MADRVDPFNNNAPRAGAHPEPLQSLLELVWRDFIARHNLDQATLREQQRWADYFHAHREDVIIEYARRHGRTRRAR